MSNARDTVTVITNTSSPNCFGCRHIGGIEGQPDFINPDCGANRTARTEKGLSTKACGLILMQYAVETEHQQVFDGNVITSKPIRILRKILLEPLGGKWEVYKYDYEARGNSELTIGLETE